MAISIFIIDDHPLAVTGLTNMLALYPQFIIAGTFLNGRSLLERLKDEQPDILLLDLLLPDYNGKDLAETIAALYSGIRIIVITSLDAPVHVKAMLKAGCQGYLLKDTDSDSLAKAIEIVYSGQEYIDSNIKEKMMDNLLNFKKKQQEKTIPDKLHLTRREKEVLELMAKERSNQEIAEELSLSIRTIENHRLNLLRKLNVKTPIGILKSAIDLGLL